MARYRSRMSKSVVKKKSGGKKKAAPKKKAGRISTGGGLTTGGALKTGGSLTNTAPQAFDGTGCIGCPESFSDAPKPIAENVTIPTGGTKTTWDPSQGGMSSADVSCAEGGSLVSGGSLETGGKKGSALKTGGRLRTGGKMDVDKTLQFVTSDMTYPEAVHALGQMDDETFYILQGLGGAFLPNVDHPLREPYIKHFGGGFQHPSNISKVATMDLLKAENPRRLAQMLHTEWRDHNRGHKVGGGLLDSLKNVFKKGVSGLKTGTKAAFSAGKKLHSALERGIDLAEQLAGPLGAVAEHLPKVNIPGVGAVDVGSIAKVAVEQAGDVSKNLGQVLNTVSEVGKIIG
ncbi:MAG: hypothetical protein V3R57_07400 [Candidatus Bathyarchaeia archaeon]